MTALTASEDGRTPKPHLTIARLKDADAARSVIDKHLQANFGPERFICEGLVIYESTLTPEGSSYSVLSHHSFRG
jgi:2'-5' RNA ligase